MPSTSVGWLGCFFDDLNPFRGLAFGRMDWVGVDGRLTGVFFTFFHCDSGLAPDAKKILVLVDQSSTAYL